ncbi:hypothetical protein M409DRAFT_29973 [Zasmidium cellare ATCC 36951]|uniref:NmrA-like domain-containing protein n=1 Tax=Zasmidium cellare ATCC 36951 TaxID=1080233 RepID=A0A6A6C032_ZASCE|nr:uncharacterized protein M409DRAFT_29973 [Zasmidium cellare ATCC 36951]KAF2159500.1 hypothetical protein M409DRAFT_29973 [Zasmidium cellare ATCC 36951]
METVLVVGATGNIGVSAVTAALRSKRNVLAIVRNDESSKRLIKHVGTSEGIICVQADVTSDNGVRNVVDQVRAGKLPAFQHVWSSVGGEYVSVPLEEIDTERLRRNMNISFEANFFAYRDTIGFLRDQNHPQSTWTICTGMQGELAIFPLPAMTQGALFPMCIAGMRENEETNVRFNEVFLGFRVEHDEDAITHGVVKASDFATVYELILNDETARSSRIKVLTPEDMKKLNIQKRY